MRRPLVSRPLTMVDALVYMAVLLVVFGGFIHLFRQASLLSRRARQHAEAFQRVQLLHTEWRRLVHQTAADQWQPTANSFDAGAGGRVTSDGARLVFTYADGRCRPLALPAGATCAFGVERDAGPAQAVLTVSWAPVRPAQARPEVARLVASVPAVAPR